MLRQPKADFEKHPLYASAYKMLSEGKHKEASQFFWLLATSFPYEKLIWLGLGASLYGAGEIREAKDAFGAAALLDQDDPDIWIHLGACELAEKNEEVAKNLFEHAKELPHFLPVHANRIQNFIGAL